MYQRILPLWIECLLSFAGLKAQKNVWVHWPFCQPKNVAVFKNQFLLENYTQRAKNFTRYHISQVNNSSPHTFSVQSRNQWRHQRSSLYKLTGPIWKLCSVTSVTFKVEKIILSWRAPCRELGPKVWVIAESVKHRWLDIDQVLFFVRYLWWIFNLNLRP